MDSDLRNAVLGKKRSALLVAEVGQKKHWPNGRVPFLIDSSLSMYVFFFFFFFELWLKLLLLTFLNVLNGGITIFLVHNLFIIFINRLNKGFTFKP